MAELGCTTRSIRQRVTKDTWEITPSRRNPIAGDMVRTYHAAGARARRQAGRKRDGLILDLGRTLVLH